MCAMRSKRFNGVLVVVGVASRVIWQQLLGVGTVWQHQTVLKGFRESGCYHTALLVKEQITEESR